MRHWAEDVARRHLQRRGWRLLDANAVVPGGELDLVMRDGAAVVAVEVRQRADDRYGSAADSLRSAKRRRLRRALRLWVLAHLRGPEPPMRVDAVLIHGDRARYRLEHLEDVA